jgi:signal transduction histidine kinase
MAEPSEADRLRSSRARLVRADDDDRRAIERDLHAGLQQQLVALGVNIQLAQLLAGSEDGELGALLRELEGEARSALDETRRLAARIHPSLVDARGLVAAIRTAAAAAEVPTRIEGGAGELPGSVAAVVYLCCVEALRNVAAHAGSGAQAKVVLRREGDAVQFEVRDDGAGFEVGREERTGLDRMQARLESLGGSLQVESEAGRGTRIAGVVYSASAR